MKITKLTLSLWLVGCMALPVMALDPDGPTPQRVLRHCTHVLARTTHRTVHTMQRVTHRAVHAIGELKEQGMDDQAAAAAQTAIQRLNGVAAHGAARIQAVAESCVAALQELEAPEVAFQMLAERVERSLTAILEAKTNLVGVVEAALAG